MLELDEHRVSDLFKTPTLSYAHAKSRNGILVPYLLGERLANMGRFCSGPTEIVRLGECFKIVPWWDADVMGEHRCITLV